jgi:phosphatidyl-myo-inositol dimannoside synthase
MDVLFVTWNFPPRCGGIENLMAELTAGLSMRHSVFVVTAYAPDTVSGENGVFRAPYPGLIPFACYALWRGAMLLIRNSAIRVVFGGSAMVAPLVYFLARLFRRKAIVQSHGLDLVYPAIFYQTLCVRWLKCCDGIVANSNYTAALAVRRGVAPNRISVVPLGVDLARFAPAENGEELKSEFGLEGKRVILFIGRLAQRKGVKEFVQKCLPDIVRAAPNACFVIAGGNPTESLAHRGDVLGEIETNLRELGLQDHARVLGEVSDEKLVKLYQCCDVFVLPALELPDDVEGFGLVLLEAAAASKPAVAIRVGGIPDAVADGESGILTDPGDYAALSAAIIRLLIDEKQRQSMGKLARQKAQKEHCWVAIVARYETILSGSSITVRQE